MQQYQIIITCGTSALTNAAKGDPKLNEIITNCSNVNDKTEIPVETKRLLDQHWGSLVDVWQNYAEAMAKQQSAELNTLLTWQRKNGIANEQCYCHLAHTDTWVGLMAAELIVDWLKANRYQVTEAQRIASLNTDDLDSFETGLANLVTWAYAVKTNYPWGKFIFNTAGGFKAVAGFAQTLGIFLADETIYKFESGNDVLAIPKLPFSWNAAETVREHLTAFRKMALGIPVEPDDRLNRLWVNKNGLLSPWGQLAWEECKPAIYREQVLPFVYDRVCEGAQFRNSVKGLPPDRIVHVNQRIDDLCRYHLSNSRENPGRLDYKPVRGGPSKLYAYEFHAWSDGQAERFFCNEKDGKIYIEKLGDHL